jgi:hypothetical protein
MEVEANDSDIWHDLSRVRTDAKGLRGVDLIQESSWDDVLLDVVAGTASGAGDLTPILVALGDIDREPAVASFAGETGSCCRLDGLIHNSPDSESGRRI